MSKLKNRKSLIVGLSLLLLIATGCTLPSLQLASNKTPTANPLVVLRASGSGTTTAILSAIAPAFEADTPGYRLETLSGTGTGGGVRGVIEGVLDVATMARPLQDEEMIQGLEYTQFGKAGVAMLTHPKVGLTSLTAAQFVAILSGQVTNWSEVGGPDQEIILYVRDENESSTKVLRQAIFGDVPFPENSLVLTSQGDMLVAVERTPGSLGYGSWPTALAQGASVQAIALDGVAPGDSAYPLTVPIGIGYLSEYKAKVQPLIDWLLSEQGQTALREFDVITTP